MGRTPAGFVRITGSLALATFAAIRAVETHLAGALGTSTVAWKDFSLVGECDSGKREHCSSDQSYHGLHFSWVEKTGDGPSALAGPWLCLFSPPAVVAGPELRSMNTTPERIPGSTGIFRMAKSDEFE